MASDVRIKLLQLVLNNPEIKRDDIRAHKDFEDEEDRTLANLLYNCKKDEQLVADESLRYTITTKGRAYLKAAGVEMPAATKPGSRSEVVTVVLKNVARGGPISTKPRAPLPPEAKGNAATRGIADKLLHQAQGALDEYIASVCNPEILGRFQAARDSACALVNSLNGVGEYPKGGERG